LGTSSILANVGSMDVKRCAHCVRPLVAVPVEDEDGFEVAGPALLCQQCDRWDPLFSPAAGA
jgi:recombinational DNA repair protein (RecF pathway)